MSIGNGRKRSSDATRSITAIADECDTTYTKTTVEKTRLTAQAGMSRLSARMHVLQAWKHMRGVAVWARHRQVYVNYDRVLDATPAVDGGTHCAHQRSRTLRHSRASV